MKTIISLLKYNQYIYKNQSHNPDKYQTADYKSENTLNRLYLKAAVRGLYLFPAIFLIIIFSGCSKKEIQEIKSSPVPVRADEVVKKMTVPYISTFGTVLYLSKADVYPTTEGYIETLEVMEGDHVKKGDVLSRLRQEKLYIEREKSASEVISKKALLRLSGEKLYNGKREAEKKIISIKNAQNSLKQKELELQNIKRIYSNKKQLFDAGGLSTEELEAVKMSFLKSEFEYIKTENDLELIRTGYRDSDIKAKGLSVPENIEEKNKILIMINTSILEAEKDVASAELSSAEAELKRIDLLIKETEIKSPITGIIGKRSFDIGEKVKPDSKMFTVFKSNKVYVRIEAGEMLFSEIKKGMMADIISGSDTTAGSVNIISPVINPETRCREIKIIVENTDGNLVPGSFVRAKIKTGAEKERILVPEDAVIKEGEKGETFVFIIRDNIVFKKQIEILFMSDENAVIKDGLSSGELVCIDPPSNLTDGREVKIIQ